jgi:hypothetical protein
VRYTPMRYMPVRYVSILLGGKCDLSPRHLTYERIQRAPA